MGDGFDVAVLRVEKNRIGDIAIVLDENIMIF